MTSSLIYVGIDVACALGKRLPICFAAAGGALTPLEIPSYLASAMPRGLGNKELISVTPYRDAARKVVCTISQIAKEMAWRIDRVAVDAPAAPPATSSRLSEVELGRLGVSSFRTPVASDWVGIREKCGFHLRSGGGTASLPYANKIGCCLDSSCFQRYGMGWMRKSSKFILSPSFGLYLHPAITSQQNRVIEISSPPWPLARGGNRIASERDLKRLSPAAAMIG